jgi:hypothetical protein
MKIIDLQKKIKVSFIASGALILLVALMIFFYIYKIQEGRDILSKIDRDLVQIKIKTIELQGKIIEAKKYRELWSTLDENKKTPRGIKMDDVNASLKTYAEKYAIFSPSIKVALPEPVSDGPFKRNTISVLFTSASLTFNAANDIKAFLFIDEFIRSLPGYPIINNIDIKKAKTYNSVDLVAISTGKGLGAIAGRVDFFWYVYKDKEQKDEPIPAKTVGRNR